MKRVSRRYFRETDLAMQPVARETRTMKTETVVIEDPLDENERSVFHQLFLGELLRNQLTPEWAQEVCRLPKIEQTDLLLYRLNARQYRALIDGWQTGWGRLTLIDFVRALACTKPHTLTPLEVQAS